ncbi:transthyretin domain protein (hydroxyisourate hydrolase) [Paraphaeosphaeria minitans]|uniref:5-hydroxyisourate hydrolase n=1 Tax=Paraphaeosphaeria minitans TaxID=565426 RepID=A0A9P6KK87_9PLEO|nr:transthyretin domain protein (hydroxyisourate hydrolase) [Paraphaeosphaeria minitans]
MPNPSSTAAQRLDAVSAHPPPTMSASEKKPPITCHVLDTSLGRPASSIPVTLTLHNPPSSLSSSGLTFSGTTNADGRVTSWAPSSPFSADALDVVFQREGDQKYSLTFDTESYFGEREVKTFFPEVEVKFVVRDDAKGEHYHVPVLLSPFGYTTYRGS